MDGKTRLSREAKALIALLQRVSEAQVSVGGTSIGKIGPGLLVFAAVHKNDEVKDIARLADRIVGYRVFPDADGRMNQSLLDASLELLLVPQFTLTADTRKGMRASFTHGAPPEIAKDYFLKLVEACRQRVGTVECGQFGADMQVRLTNDGPVTFWLES